MNSAAGVRISATRTEILVLKAFLKTIPTKMKPTKYPAREKKNEARKAKKEGRRESEK